LAWGRIGKTAWQGATTALVTARTLDSSDARTPAYLGVVLEGTGKSQEATVAFRTALALEEARLRLDEPATRTDKPVSRDALDFGLAMEMRFRIASQLEKTGRIPEALELYRSAAEYEPRLTRGWESRQMFTAMLPDQPPDRGAAVPAPRNAATLIAQAHLQTGKLLAKRGSRMRPGNTSRRRLDWGQVE
jgi:tetratricopeptide (TPR) repeat protein